MKQRRSEEVDFQASPQHSLPAQIDGQFAENSMTHLKYGKLTDLRFQDGVPS